jgi:TonB family protein
MKRKSFVLILLALAINARAATTLDIKLNFFGPAAAGKAGASVTTSFHLASMVQRNLQVKFTTEAMLAELRRTFNAADVSLLAAGDLHWASDGDPTVTQAVQIDGRDYAIGITPLPKPGGVNVKVAVVEKSPGERIENVLLDTEVVLPDGEVAMLGFRDPHERSFFIALYVQGRDEEFGRGAVRLAGEERPKAVRKTDPVYPDEAKKSGVQGVVTVEAVIGKDGKVKAARAVGSPEPLLAQAALDAVKQWEYEPFVSAKGCREVLFTVTMRFVLRDGDKKAAGVAPTRLEASRRPKLIKKVLPVFPAEAKKDGVQGAVVLEVRTDEQGRVKDLRVTSDTPALLNQAAMDAVRQWQYEPFVKDGKAVPVAFTVTVTFALN